jgi:hypothetical protein
MVVHFQDNPGGITDRDVARKFLRPGDVRHSLSSSLLKLPVAGTPGPGFWFGQTFRLDGITVPHACLETHWLVSQ